MASTQSADGWPQSVVDAGTFIRMTEGVWAAVAQVLGGGSSLNGGIFFEETEAWFAKALPGVNWQEMHASYLSLQHELAYPSAPTEFGLAWNKAMTEAGYGVADLKEPQLQIINTKPFVPYTTYNFSEPGHPRKASSHLVHSRAHLSNLEVLTSAHVDAVLFSDTTAKGVKITLMESGKPGKSCENVEAKKGVIMAAGAIMTPKLLQLSGVGPKAIVEGLKQKVISDVPVGMNFVDRLVANAAVVTNKPFELTVGYTVMADAAKKQVIEGVGGGKIVQELSMASVALAPPRERYAWLRGALRNLFKLMPQPAINLMNSMVQGVNLQMDTASRGHVKAVTADPHADPVISANYFSAEGDLESQVARFNEVMRVAQQDAMAPFTRGKLAFPMWMGELVRKFVPHVAKAFSCLFHESNDLNFTVITFPCPGALTKDTPAIEKYVRDNIVSSYHYFGTAASGTVLDPKDFSVKGTKNLYVADASAMPHPTSVNPQASIMALGHYVGKLLGKAKVETEEEVTI